MIGASVMKELHSLVPRINRAIGLLSKIRHYVSKPLSRTSYFSHFISHLIRTCQIWGQEESVVRKISGLQNKNTRIINFKPFTHPVDELYSSNKILKITFYVKLINCIFVKEVRNKTSLERFHRFHKQTDSHGHWNRHALRIPTDPNMGPFQLNTKQPGMRAWNSMHLKNLKLKPYLHSSFFQSYDKKFMIFD